MSDVKQLRLKSAPEETLFWLDLEDSTPTVPDPEEPSPTVPDPEGPDPDAEPAIVDPFDPNRRDPVFDPPSDPSPPVTPTPPSSYCSGAR